MLSPEIEAFLDFAINKEKEENDWDQASMLFVFKQNPEEPAHPMMSIVGIVSEDDTPLYQLLWAMGEGIAGQPHSGLLFGAYALALRSEAWMLMADPKDPAQMAELKRYADGDGVGRISEHPLRKEVVTVCAVTADGVSSRHWVRDAESIEKIDGGEGRLVDSLQFLLNALAKQP